MNPPSIYSDAPSLRCRACVNLVVTILLWLFTRCIVLHWIYFKLRINWVFIHDDWFAQGENIEVYCFSMLALNVLTFHPRAKEWIDPKQAQTMLLLLQIATFVLLSLALTIGLGPGVITPLSEAAS